MSKIVPYKESEVNRFSSPETISRNPTHGLEKAQKNCAQTHWAGKIIFAVRSPVPFLGYAWGTKQNTAAVGNPFIILLLFI